MLRKRDTGFPAGWPRIHTDSDTWVRGRGEEAACISTGGRSAGRSVLDFQSGLSIGRRLFLCGVVGLWFGGHCLYIYHIKSFAYTINETKWPGHVHCMVSLWDE